MEQIIIKLAEGLGIPLGVIFAGIRASARTLVKAAIEEDASIIGVSCLSGAHRTIAEQILKAKQDLGAPDLKIVMGGIIPKQDVGVLSHLGVDLVVPTGNGTIDDAVRQISALVPSVGSPLSRTA